ncbi:alpha/beta hydrolase [Aequorivita sp. H23M31]|uniref:Alpha/beta hydrolase n=1 Tax=Aequorivita ciconiae TaxID=2494375 RepID=A0A410FZC3_9FLAO|nr:alpha/beta hydrolase [Aequorivita sp. H23M31]QAA80365.1 alpha/beta hydrolase [Aequorivita sp. H23M31]
MQKPKVKPALILLSDLWGEEKSDWVENYKMALREYFDIECYDSCVLGDVRTTGYDEKHIHDQFVNSGIEMAVEKLVLQVPDAPYILGFSVGGVIAWKAALAGIKAKRIFAVSSTRLRYETQKPSGLVELFYGENDLYTPTRKWFQQMGITQKLYKDADHEFYKKPAIAEDICNRIISSLKRDRPQ